MDLISICWAVLVFMLGLFPMSDSVIILSKTYSEWLTWVIGQCFLFFYYYWVLFFSLCITCVTISFLFSTVLFSPITLPVYYFHKNGILAKYIVLYHFNLKNFNPNLLYKWVQILFILFHLFVLIHTICTLVLYCLRYANSFIKQLQICEEFTAVETNRRIKK